MFYVYFVPTPFKENHDPDISYVEAATMAIIPYTKN
jgi:UDP-N-acetyl-D-mannosaminuronic acid dehydrogenase